EAVNVGPGVEVAEGHRLLRAHVAGRPDLLARLREREAPGSADGARDPEIGYNRVRARQQDVLGLDVAVDDPLGMGERERVGDVARDVQRVFERQPPLPYQA